MTIRERLIADFQHRRTPDPAADVAQLAWFDAQAYEWRPGHSGWENAPGETTWYVYTKDGHYVMRGTWLPGLIEALMEREAEARKS